MRPIERKHVYWHCICGSEAESALQSVSPDSRPFMLQSLWPSCCNLYCFSTDERIWWFPWRKIEPVTVCLERCQVRWKESWTWIWKRHAWPWESHLLLWRSSFPVSEDQAWNEPFWCLRMLWWLSDIACVSECSLCCQVWLSFIQHIIGGLYCTAHTRQLANTDPCSNEPDIFIGRQNKQNRNVTCRPEGRSVMEGKKQGRGTGIQIYLTGQGNPAEEVTGEHQPPRREEGPILQVREVNS